ncbi:MAG: hypothetical protein ACXU8U_10780, partial [Asticcacaulis sp.]
MIAFALFALQAAAIPAHPDDPAPFDMTPYYQGTLEVDQLGEADHMVISPGGRYVMYGVKIARVPGAWWFDKDQFCVLPDPQPGVVASPFCMGLDGRRTGDSWTRTFGDVKVTFTLQP